MALPFDKDATYREKSDALSDEMLNPEKNEMIKAGDFIEIERNLHTFSNNADVPAIFLVIKRIPTGKDCSHIFKTDKVTDE